MYKQTIYILILSFIIVPSSAQVKTFSRSSNNGLQYGFGLKAYFEISTVTKTQKPHFKIALTGGIASSFINNNIYPSLNGELLFYNNGLGSKKPGSNTKPSVNIDFITALTVTAGVKDLLQQKRQNIFLSRTTPLYYFADFGRPALRNPFAYSISIGTNFIFNNDPNKKFQRIGFANFHFDRFQLSYYNDGGVPFSDIYLGDRRDRYYTGGFVASWHGKPTTELNLIELSYHKFTGYTRNAFEASNQFDFAFINYKDTIQRYYNKSMWTLNLANIAKGYGLNFKLYNSISWDVQHLIHWAIFNSYHIVPYKKHLSVNGTYYFNNTYTGLK